MSKITQEQIEKAFEVAKECYRENIILSDAKNILVKNGMNANSATGYIYNYRYLVEGKLYTRTMNAVGTEYYLKMIYYQNGQKGLENALISVSQHIDYYEEKSGSSVNKTRAIFTNYLNFLDKKPEMFTLAEEVDDSIKYSEGKTRTVLINSYERNPLARQKCIEHHGPLCKVCQFDFEKTYGTIGRYFIHVHHKIDIATIGNEYSIDPINDLIPVCPNCHAMLHKKKPAYSIDELKKFINSLHHS